MELHIKIGSGEKGVIPGRVSMPSLTDLIFPELRVQATQHAGESVAPDQGTEDALTLRDIGNWSEQIQGGGNGGT